MGTRHDKIGQTHSLCPECGAVYSKYGGGHCRGGAYGGCCRTFTSDTSADAHRVGPHDPPGLRRCLTDEELRTITWKNDGTIRWHLTSKGWSNGKPRQYHRALAANAAEPLFPSGGTDVPDSHEKAVVPPARPVESVPQGPSKPWRNPFTRRKR